MKRQIKLVNTESDTLPEPEFNFELTQLNDIVILDTSEWNNLIDWLLSHGIKCQTLVLPRRKGKRSRVQRGE